MFFDIIKVIILGIVEGITEWLPISSTGHLILIEEFLTVNNMSSDFYPVFMYVIQFAAILAVIVYYFSRLWPFGKSKSSEEKKNIWHTWFLVLIGVIPAGVFGLVLDDWLDKLLTDSGAKCFVVAGALILYGILFIIIERLRKGKENRISSISDMPYLTALYIGLFQVLSIIPGTSRSGSTILGAMTLGVSRTAAAEFSFFMSIPVMVGVSLLKSGKFALACVGGEAAVSGNELILLLVGCLVAFIVSLAAIRFLMDFVKRHSFEAFGWYRIIVGALVLIYFAVK